MSNTLKTLLEVTEVTQTELSAETGILQSRISNLCNMTQDRLESSVKDIEHRKICGFFESMFFCFKCEKVHSWDELKWYTELDMGYVVYETQFCKYCGSDDWSEIDPLIDFDVP